MSTPKQWHREAAIEIHDNARYLVDMSVSVDKLAERIASHDPSNADRQSEIGGVDVDRNMCINILGKLGTLFQECVSYEQSGFDQEPEERFDGDKWQREGIKIIAAAIKATGGKK